MLFRNSVRLLMENFKNVYKILLYKFVVGLITSALYCAMLLPELTELANSAQMREVISTLKELFTAFFSANASGLSAAKDALLGADGALHGLFALIVSRAMEIALTTVGCVLVYLLGRMADTVCYFTVGSVLNDKMSTYAETPFRSAYVANFGRASVYALVYVPVAFLMDVAAIGVCYLLLTSVNIFAALFFSMSVIVLEQSLKMTFTGRWMPALTADGKRLKDSLRCEDKTEKKQRPKLFATYVATVYAIIIVNVVAAACTFGSALLLSVPASYLLFVCVQYVHYYTVKGKKYFITYERIASNPDRGDREHFFNYVDEDKSSEV